VRLCVIIIVPCGISIQLLLLLLKTVEVRMVAGWNRRRSLVMLNSKYDVEQQRNE
jgi:hypothetical protein